MKKSTSSITKSQAINSSQRKRMRSSTPVQQEEDLDLDADDDSVTFSSQKKVKKVTSQNSKEKKVNYTNNHVDHSTPVTLTPSGSHTSFSLSSSNDAAPTSKQKTSGRKSNPSGGLREKKFNHTNNHADHSTIVTSTPSESSISFSLSSSNDAASTNNQKTSGRKSNPSAGLKEKNLYGTQGPVNDSVIYQKNSSGKALTQTSKKSCSSNTASVGTFNRPITSQPKIVPSPSVSRENLSSQMKNSSQCPDVLNRSKHDQLSSSASSNDFNSSSKVNIPISASIEASLEFREMKRMYLHERDQAEEWRKDFQILKKQLAKVKATTIPRPTAEVLEWLQELLYLINNNTSFTGDGRDLKKIGEDLGLDEASLLTVVARTPQKSALKLFRLLYPTMGSRANCISISEMAQEQLENIYYYVRNLHKNLNFSKDDMRKAIGTSIRSAKRDLRRQEYYQQQRTSALRDQENINPDETDEGIDTEATFNRPENLVDEFEDVMNEDEDDRSDDGENEDDDEEMDNLMIDEELDEEDE